MRGVLGLFNAGCLIRYRNGLTGAFGEGVGRWYLLLQATQFHVVFYASRTLPNMFAFGLSKFRYCAFLKIKMKMGVLISCSDLGVCGIPSGERGE